ncbi:sugar ABC transporter permease [Actibacterium mucosum KCTC 23349]|uniref:Sugar ABC transporter permease n=2 Tax=Actibacterium TaxID=1433986 RepID=A0A037ZKT3_9RHOB|nr:sugar ABC transporter permease [Actibacterium mucosum KCTC 23349]
MAHTHTAPAAASRPSRLRKAMRDGRLTTILFFLPPALMLFTLFVFMPLLEGAWYSGFKWSGYGEGPTDWVGSRNFERLTKHSTFMRSFNNTLVFVGVALLLQIPLGMAMALLIYRKSKSNTFFRLVFFVPFILAEVATGLIWSFIFDGDYGVTSIFTTWFGWEQVYPLADRTWAMPVLLLVFVWKYFGFHMMIFIAALQSIPDDLIEAARIDGGTPWQITRYIQIPMLKPAIVVSVFFAVVGSLQLFDLIIPLTRGGPSNTTHTLVSYLYNFGLVRQKVGFGSSVGVVLFIVSFVFAFSYRRFVMRQGEK